MGEPVRSRGEVKKPVRADFIEELLEDPCSAWMGPPSKVYATHKRGELLPRRTHFGRASPGGGTGQAPLLRGGRCPVRARRGQGPWRGESLRGARRLAPHWRCGARRCVPSPRRGGARPPEAAQVSGPERASLRRHRGHLGPRRSGIALRRARTAARLRATMASAVMQPGRHHRPSTVRAPGRPTAKISMSVALVARSALVKHERGIEPGVDLVGHGYRRTAGAGAPRTPASRAVELDRPTGIAVLEALRSPNNRPAVEPGPLARSSRRTPCVAHAGARWDGDRRGRNRREGGVRRLVGCG
jgi:hypothetical protein